MINCREETKKDPVYLLYQETKPSENRRISDYEAWCTNITALQRVLVHTKIQTQKYADQILKSSNYFKQVFVPKLITLFEKPTEAKVKINCKKIKEIITAKWQAINQNYFQQSAKHTQDVRFLHPRLGKLFSELTPETVNKIKKYNLKNQILKDIIGTYPKKMFTKQFIALSGLLFSGKYEINKTPINIGKLSQETIDITICFEPMFQKKEMQVFIQQKVFTNANTQKLLNNVKLQPAYQKAGKEDFRDEIRQQQVDNTDYFFLMMGCCLQLEYLNQYVRQKRAEQYIENLALFEGHNLCKGVILGQLSELYKDIGDMSDEEEQDVVKKFIQFFDNIFTEQCDEINLVKGICKGIVQKMRINPRLQVKDVIKNYWCRNSSI